MQKEGIEKYLGEYKEAIVEDVRNRDDKALSQTLTLLMKDVDRDARHAAAEKALECQRDIMNL